MCALCTSIAHHSLSFTLQTMSEFKSSITKKHHCSINCTKMCIDNESNVWVVFTWNNICTIFFWFPSKVFEDVNLPDRPQLKTAYPQLLICCCFFDGVHPKNHRPRNFQVLLLVLELYGCLHSLGEFCSKLMTDRYHQLTISKFI